MTERDITIQRNLRYPSDTNQDHSIECVNRNNEPIDEERRSYSRSPKKKSSDLPYEPSYSSSDIPPNAREQLSAHYEPSLSVHSMHEYRVSQQESWEYCRKLASVYDSEMCGAWKAELDNLLIFAGLFSAAVTAFTIDSYKWLQQDSAQYNARVLSLIYQELNPTTSAQTLSTIPNLLPQRLVVRINIYWFLSLTLGLTTSLIGIIASQWLREYQRETSLPSQGRLSVRQMRYEGLVFWGVPRIISFLPLFLQLGFILFMIGILELLWQINTSVAIAITIPIGLVFVFLMATVALPTIQYVFLGGEDLRIPQCPYKSPQSLGLLRFVVFLSGLLPMGWKKTLSRHGNMKRLFNSSYSWSWQHFDAFWRKLRETSFSTTRSLLDAQAPYDIVRSLAWLVDTHDETSENILSILQCLQLIPVASAVQIITKSWVDMDLDLDSRMEDVCNLLQNNLLTTKPTQDVIAVAFLHGYQRSHPTLRTLYWSSHIRLMRNKLIPRHLIDWYGTELSFADLAPDLQLQLLKSLNGLLENNLASPFDIQNIWQVVYALMNPELFEIEWSELHIEWCFKLFASFEVWLGRPPGRDSDLMDRAMLSVNGIRMVVDDRFFEKWSSCPDYDKFLNFVRKLNVILDGLGGPLKLLHLESSTSSSRQDIWATYMQWIFSKA